MPPSRPTIAIMSYQWKMTAWNFCLKFVPLRRVSYMKTFPSFFVLLSSRSDNLKRRTSSGSIFHPPKKYSDQTDALNVNGKFQIFSYAFDTKFANFNMKSLRTWVAEAECFKLKVQSPISVHKVWAIPQLMFDLICYWKLIRLVSRT